MRRWFLRLTLALASLLAALGGVEAWTRRSEVARTRFNGHLRYQGADVDVFTPVPGPLLFRLKPGAELRMTHPSTYTVHVDPFGARGRAHPEPAAGTFRVLFLGGSTVYGPFLDDDETIPAVLERRLRAEGRPVEVWNLGANAYVTAQTAHLAREELERLKPDLELLLFTNRGARAFLQEPDNLRIDRTAFFRADPTLFLENFPPPAGLSLSAHQAAMQLSGIYRYWAASRPEGAGGQDNPWVIANSRREVSALEAEARAAGVTVLYLLHPAEGEPPAGEVVIPEEYPPGLDPARIIRLSAFFYGPPVTEHHPHEADAEAYAAAVQRALVARGVLPAPAP